MLTNLWGQTAGRPVVAAATLLVFALLADGLQLGLTPSAANAASAGIGPQVVAEADRQAPDVISARIAAASRGVRVEVMSERTETSQMFVNPDGTVTEETASAPMRIASDSKDGWRDIDLDLQRSSDGTIRPASPYLEVSMSGGTRSNSALPLATAESEDRSISIDWNGDLPEPSIQGDTATYANVAENTDLVVRATRYGFEQYFKIKQQPRDPVDFELPLQILTENTEVENSPSDFDGAALLDDGHEVGSISPAFTWDNSTDPSVDSAAVTISRMEIEPTPNGGSLVITPSAALLSDPDTEYPLTVDPSFSYSSPSDTFVRSDQPTTNFWSDPFLRTGLSGGVTYRSYLKFNKRDSNQIERGSIAAASLNLFQQSAANCTPTQIQIFAALSVPDMSQITWNNRPSVAASSHSDSSSAKGSSGCSAGYISANASSAMQYLADNPLSGAYVFEIRSSETSSAAYKVFQSTNYNYVPTLSVTYDAAPALPVAVRAVGAVKYAGDVYIGTGRPTVAGHTTDADGQTAKIQYDVFSSATTSPSNLLASCTSAYVASGATASCVLDAALPNNTTLYLRARAFSSSGGLSSGYTSAGSYSFRTSLGVPPAAPIQCPTGYAPSGSWLMAVPTASVRCSFAIAASSSNSAPVSVRASLDGQDLSEIPVQKGLAFTSTTQQSFELPRTNGLHTLTTTTVSLGGRSKSTSYLVGYGAPAISSTLPGSSVWDRVPLKVDAPGTYGSTVSSAYVQWRAAGATAWSSPAGIPAASITSTPSNSPVSIDTTWSAADSLAGSDQAHVPALLELRVCLQYVGSGTSGLKCTTDNLAAPLQIARDPRGAPNAPYDAAGPGSVDLWTGALSVSANDVALNAPTGTLSVSRDLNTMDPQNVTTNPQDKVFGPGWTASFAAPEQGFGAWSLVDHTTVDGTISLTSTGFGTLIFREPSKSTISAEVSGESFYTAADTNTKASGAKLRVLVASDSIKRIEMLAATGTVTRWKASSPSIQGPVTWSIESVQQPGATQALTFTTNAEGLVSRILAPVPTAKCGTVGFPACNGNSSEVVALQCASLVRGCTALTIDYASSTAISSDSNNDIEGAHTGDIAGQVRSVTYTGWSSSSSQMVSEIVARYRYFENGRLAIEFDPRSALDNASQPCVFGTATATCTVATTEYTYRSDGRLASTRNGSRQQSIDSSESRVTQPTGQKAYRLGYDAQALPRIISVGRDNVDGSGVSTVSSYIYDVPLDATGLPDLTAARIAHWDQTSMPQWGVAVFGADHPVAGGSATTLMASSGWSSSDWRYSTLMFANARGALVDSAYFADGAWRITASDYDREDRAIREFDPQSIDYLDGIAASDPAAAEFEASSYASLTQYNAELRDDQGNLIAEEGSYVSDEWGPAMDSDVDGETMFVRTHTHYCYDENLSLAPSATDGCRPRISYPEGTSTFGLVSSEIVTVVPGTAGTTVRGQVYAGDVLSVQSAKHYDYRPQEAGADAFGPTSGWVIGEPGATVTEMGTGSSSDDIVTRTVYNSDGRPVRVEAAGGPPQSEATTLYTYYSAGANSDDSRCGLHPEWTGLVCSESRPVAAQYEALPTVFTSGYDLHFGPLSTVETSGSGNTEVSRTTSASYLPDGRVRDVSTDATTPPGSASLDHSFNAPRRETLYSPADGQVSSVRTVNSAGNVLSSVQTTYDSWGRPRTFTDSTGQITTSTYVPSGQVGAGELASSSNFRGVVVRQYGGPDHSGSSELRSVATKEIVKTATGAVQASFTAMYDPYGAADHEEVFNASGELRLAVDETNDAAGNEVSRVLSVGSVGMAWLSNYDAGGRLVGLYNPFNADGSAADGSFASLRYTYDRMGRLVRVEDRTSSAGCAIRTYEFDKMGNRVRSSAAQPAADGECATGQLQTSSASTFDLSSRIRSTIRGSSSGSYTYDLLGRTTYLPGVDSPGSGFDSARFTYFDDDAARSVTTTLAGVETTETFDRDALGRTMTDTVSAPAGTEVTTSHYADSSLTASSWDMSNSTAVHSTRVESSLTGAILGLTENGVGTTAVLLDPSGNAVSSVAIDGPSGVSSGWSTFDEFGVNRGGPAQPLGLGWAADAHKRPTKSGLIELGARIYNSATGRFLVPDAVRGGNENAYVYPADPINSADMDGNKRRHKYHRTHVTLRLIGRHVHRRDDFDIWIPGNDHFQFDWRGLAQEVIDFLIGLIKYVDIIRLAVWLTLAAAYLVIWIYQKLYIGFCNFVEGTIRGSTGYYIRICS